MASIRREIVVEAPADEIWAAVRDVGAPHERLVPGFLTDSRMDGDARVVTFANGVVVRELIVDIDDRARRVVWAAVGGKLTHHNASLQVFADGPARSRVVWTADLLPNELAGYVTGLIEQGLGVMKQTLEAQTRPLADQRFR
jgi:carbon monoxide dehydrogenase subunit G